MDDFTKGWWAGVVTTLVSSLVVYAIISFILTPPQQPDGESLVIEYENPTPYERTLVAEIANSITNSFKIKHYHMEKYKYRMSLYNPKENAK